MRQALLINGNEGERGRGGERYIWPEGETKDRGRRGGAKAAEFERSCGDAKMEVLPSGKVSTCEGVATPVDIRGAESAVVEVGVDEGGRPRCPLKCCCC